MSLLMPLDCISPGGLLRLDASPDYVPLNRDSVMMLPPRTAAPLQTNCGSCLLILLAVTALPSVDAGDPGQPARRVNTASDGTVEPHTDARTSDALKAARKWMDALLEGGVREVAGDAWPTELDFGASDAGTSAAPPLGPSVVSPHGNAAGFASSSASVASNEIAISTAANSGNRILKTIEEQFPLMVFGVVCAAGICAVSWLTKP